MTNIYTRSNQTRFDVEENTPPNPKPDEEENVPVGPASPWGIHEDR